MFGYILAYQDELTEPQKQRYGGCYCGLCHAIGQECGQVSRLSLNYDMTFLAMVLNSLDEPEEIAGQKRCAMHPVKSHSFWRSQATDYCAVINVALSYYKCLDDWQDDKNLGKLALAKTFAPSWRKAQRLYPAQTQAITTCLAELSQMEAEKIYHVDRAANLFGDLMGELFVPDPADFFAPQLRQLGQGLGRFIYLLDAVCDLPDDRKKGRYNPLLGWKDGSENPKDYEEFLEFYLGEATCAFEQLPLVTDVEILRNILYQGVWIKYELAVQAYEKAQKKEGGQPDE